jgi:hypothetical protein
MQQSILEKLLLARCINSAAFLFIRTDRSDLFSQDFVTAIQYILIADALVTPLTRYLNLWDLFQRYVLARLAPTQDEMNAKWQGAEWTLAERYTDCLKTIFMGLCYAVPLPSGLFLVSLTMMTVYLVDKYSLFCLWKRKPAINASLGVVSKNFFAFSVVSHAVASWYFFSGWPFCPRSVDEEETPDKDAIERFYYISFFLLFCFFLLGGIVKFARSAWKHYYDHISQTGEIDETAKWRSINKAEIFLPQVKHIRLPSPLICGQIERLPLQYIVHTSEASRSGVASVEVQPKSNSILNCL